MRAGREGAQRAAYDAWAVDHSVRTMMRDPLADVLSRFGYALLAPAERIGAGTLNHNYLVRTDGGAFVLRRIRDDQPDARVAFEHDTLRWVAAQGFPVATPIAPSVASSRRPADELPATCVRLEPSDARGETERGRWALFPFVEGRFVRRGALRTTEAATLGDMHGRLHAALRDHPRSADARFDMQWSAEQSAAALERIEHIARSRDASAEALEGIALQRRLLDGSDVRPPSAFAQLPCQWMHGDFHVEQVLFAAGASITAILDWELCQSNARAWELIRSLAFSGLLDGPDAATYLRAYRCHVPIRRDELELGLSLWWQSRIVGVWVWWAAFVAGNDRVHAFIPDTAQTLRRLSEPGWRDRVDQRILNAAQDPFG